MTDVVTMRPIQLVLLMYRTTEASTRYYEAGAISRNFNKLENIEPNPTNNNVFVI